MQANTNGRTSSCTPDPCAHPLTAAAPWEDERTWLFVEQHANDDPTRLLLGSHAGVDLRFAIAQIEGRQRMRSKLPTLSTVPRFVFPPKLNCEQCSSEATAAYKASRLPIGGCVADLTGGLGIDTYYLARRASTAYYCELNPTLHDTAAHNFALLGQTNITTACTDGLAWLKANEAQPLDMIYADPARRDDLGRRVYAMEACEPNLVPELPWMLQRAACILIKASPMVDIADLLGRLPSVAAVHILSVGGECKEVLLELRAAAEEPLLHIVGLMPDGGIRFHLTTTRRAEAQAEVRFAASVSRYLYLPDAALLKGGVFRSLSAWYGVEKLDRNTHLYTAPHHVADFPGRCLEVEETVALHAKTLRTLLPEGQAHVLSHNYPVGADALRHQLRLREGGNLYVVATTLSGRKVGLLCRRK